MGYTVEVQSESQVVPARASQEFHRSWKVLLLAILGVVVSTTGIVTYAFGVFIAPLAKDTGWTQGKISGWATFLWMGTILGSPLAGYAADRFGARLVILLGIPAYAVALLSVCLIHGGIWKLYVAAFAVGTAGAMASATVYMRVISGWFEAGRGLALGMTAAGTGISGMFAPRLAQAVVDGFGWRIGFAAIPILILLTFPLCFLLLHERRELGRRDGGLVETGFTLREALSRRVFWLINLALLLHMIAAGAGLFYLIPFLTSTGLSRAVAATYAGMFGIASISGRVIAGFLVDRFRGAFITACLFLTAAAGFAVLGLFQAHGALWAFALIGFGHGGEAVGASYCTAQYFGLKAYGRTLGIVTISMAIGLGLGPPLLDYLLVLTGTFAHSYLLLSPFGVVAAFLFLIISRIPPPNFARTAVRAD